MISMHAQQTFAEFSQAVELGEVSTVYVIYIARSIWIKDVLPRSPIKNTHNVL